MYVSNRLAEIENKDIKDMKIVTCHLGQGSSICAVEGGKSVDTSMGLTPLAGIPMVTRSGDLDPSVVTFLMKKENLTPEEIENKLNKESGVQGISGLAPDFREVEEESVDAIVFTGGVGENQIKIREGICNQLTFMGVEIDPEKNNIRSEEKLVSKDSSKVKVYVIPTNEELMIAKETERLIKK